MNATTDDSSCVSQQAKERQPCYTQEDYCTHQEQRTGLENLLLAHKLLPASITRDASDSKARSQASAKHLYSSKAKEMQLALCKPKVQNQVSLPKVRQTSVFCQPTTNPGTLRTNRRESLSQGLWGMSVRILPACTPRPHRRPIHRVDTQRTFYLHVVTGAADLEEDSAHTLQPV